MRLYSLTEATSVTDPQYGTFTAGPDGGFDFPGPLSARLHAVHVRGQKQWETAIERQQREIAADLARRQSPEALYEAVSRLVQAADSASQAPPADTKAAPKAAAKSAAPAADAK